MKHFLYLTLVVMVSSLPGQSFEWNKPADAAPAPAHPKEVEQTVRSLDSGKSSPREGLAGIYKPEDDGIKTAYGEVYRASEMTGSHAALPLGTLLRVTNVENGKSVVVRITDRGRECADCLLTLSELAAEKLGMADKSSVTFERDGFSNWNPSPDRAVTAASGDAPVVAATAIAVPPKPAVVPGTAQDDQPDVFTREVTLPETDERIAAVADPVAVSPPAPTVGANAQARGVDADPTTFAVQLAAYTNEGYAQRRIEELKALGLSNVFYRSQAKDGGEVINRVYAGPYRDAGAAQAAVKEIASAYQIEGIVARQ